MKPETNILAIIPARGGSKGIPQKNMRIVAGKPLIEYTIETAKKSEYLSKIVVSTDDSDILKFAKSQSIDVVKRPADLSTDNSDVLDTVFHVLEYLKNKGESFDVVVLLQPTAPLRLPQDIDAAINLMTHSEKDGLISVVEVNDHHPARMYEIDENNCLSNFLEYGETTRRQDLNKLYIRNGAIYIIKTEALLKENTLMPKKKIAYIMNKRWAVNIDEELDLDVLEVVIKKWIEKYGDFNS